MKNFILGLLMLLFLNIHQTKAQVLPMPVSIQEYDQWCWAAVSKSILSAYGYTKNQCEIADYARSVITWKSFGTVNCCVNANVGCNYWNYNWGLAGSIQDILVHFGSLDNYGVVKPLSKSEVTTEIVAGRPFVIRWGWTSGGGHFIVGHGIVANSIHYMNPWFGEGAHIGDYNWMVSSTDHNWTHTNLITTKSLGLKDKMGAENEIALFPNPIINVLHLNALSNVQRLSITDVTGKIIFTEDNVGKNIVLDVSQYISGIYFVTITTANKTEVRKLHKL